MMAVGLRYMSLFWSLIVAMLLLFPGGPRSGRLFYPKDRFPSTILSPVSFSVVMLLLIS
jgi:hypothetical protein